MSSTEKKGGNDFTQFIVGLVMTIVGGYLFFTNVEVTTSSIFKFSLFGRRLDGLIFVPLIASIIFLFYRYGFASKLCCGISIAIIVTNVIMNLRLYWNATSLFSTIVIFVLFFGGIGLTAKVLFANPKGDHGKKY